MVCKAHVAVLAAGCCFGVSWAGAASSGVATLPCDPGITIDGVVDFPTEGWTRLLEANSRPFLPGGSAVASDAVGESSTFHWWDGINNVDVAMNDNRGDIIDIHYAPDVAVARTPYYLAVRGPTAPFTPFVEQTAAGSGDVGDLFVAIGNPRLPDDFVAARAGHPGFGSGPEHKAVDFFGWLPRWIVGVQFYDTTTGDGFARIYDVQTGQMWDAAPNDPSAPFLWTAAIATGADAAFDTFNQNAGVFEFEIPREIVPLMGRYVAAYTTQNFAGSDAYDSAPGIGQPTMFEQIGDCPGDPDSDGQLGACDPGSSFGSTASANFVAVLSDGITNPVGPGDGVDTIVAAMETLISIGCNPADLTTTGTDNGCPDGVIDLSDFAYYLRLWGERDPIADITTTGSVVGIPDGKVDLSDFSVYLSWWCCACP